MRSLPQPIRTIKSHVVERVVWSDEAREREEERRERGKGIGGGGAKKETKNRMVLIG